MTNHESTGMQLVRPNAFPGSESSPVIEGHRLAGLAAANSSTCCGGERHHAGPLDPDLGVCTSAVARVQGEVKLLLALLPKYAAHVAKYPHTLLIKFYGLHRVRPLKGAKVGWLSIHAV